MPIITTSDAKAHLRVFHAEDDTYIASLVVMVAAEWERVTHQSLTAATEYSHVYAVEPEDCVLRAWHHPVDVAADCITYTDTAGNPQTIGTASHWLTLDTYSQYVLDDVERAAIVYPLTLTYETGGLPDDVKIALLLRLGYFYAYRGDDVNPPDSSAWQMLAARHRTGALL